MKLARTAVCALAVFGLAVGVNGQAGLSPAPLLTSEKHSLIGEIKVDSLPGRRTRIELWVNTPIYLAKGVVLEADSFGIRREGHGGVLIESAVPVRVTGFALTQNINNVTMLQHAAGNVLTWEEDFKVRVLADSTLEWACCPRKE